MIVDLFYTCLVNEFAPEVGFAAVRVLERLGCEVAVPPGQTCCGQPAFNAGFHDAARVAARYTIEILEATSRPVVIPSGSCGDMIAHQYQTLFAAEPGWLARAHALAQRAVEFSQFVAPRIGGGFLGTLATSVVYHPSCHLSRGLGITREPELALAALNGVRAIPIVDQHECCGFGGLFAIKHGDISSSILSRKLEHVTAAAPDRLVSCDLGCLLHLGGGLHRRQSPIKVQHLAELIDEAV